MHLRTPGGDKTLFLRGWLGPNGKKGFVQGRVTAVAGDREIWNVANAAPADSLTITPSPDAVTGGVASASPMNIPTSVAGVSIAGGVAPFSYSWAQLSGDVFDIISPAAPSTYFRASLVDPGQTSTGVFQCTVTDAHGATGTAEVNATCTNYGGL